MKIQHTKTYGMHQNQYQEGHLLCLPVQEMQKTQVQSLGQKISWVGSARVFNDKHLHLKRKVKVIVAQFCLDS